MSATRTFLINPNYVSLIGWKQIIKDTEHFQLSGSVSTLDDLPLSKVNDWLILADLSRHEETTLDKVSVLLNQANLDLLLVVDLEDTRLIHDLKQIGIRGILTTHCDAEEITKALECIRLGKRFYCADILKVLEQPQKTQKALLPATDLSSRELDVLALVVKGLKTSQIADQLHVSTHTINSHRKNMLKKLGLTSPVELIVYAAKNGLVQLN